MSSPFTLSDFGGLDLASDPSEVGFGGAIDMSDVDFDKLGRIRSRDGVTTRYSAAAGGGAPVPGTAIVFEASSGPQLVLVGADNTGFYAATALNSSYTVHATQSTNSIGRPVAFGTPSASSMYFTGDTGLYKYDGTTFTHVVNSLHMDGGYLAVQKPDNRLVAARITVVPSGSSATASISTVVFSGAGTPETFNANDYVYLTPGDGEGITGMCSWGDLLFVFKHTKFFVFYGNTTDATGQPVFNYRVVDAGVGCLPVGESSATNPQACVSTPHGVFFLHETGIYLTTGSTPVKVSGALDPFFRNETLPFFNVTARLTNPQYHRLTWMRRRLYFHAYTTASVNGVTITFVYDPETQQWLVWNKSFGFALDWGVDGFGSPKQRFLVDFGAGTTKLYEMIEGQGSDDGVAVNGWYQSGYDGFFIHGLRSTRPYPGMRKTIRETRVLGSGAVHFGWAADYGSVTTSALTSTLPSAPTTGIGWHRVATSGVALSYKVSGSGPWTVNELVPYLREVTPR